MKTLCGYLRKNAGAVGLTAVCMALLAGVFFFSRAPLAPVVYGGVLCVFVGLVWLGVGCLRYGRRRRTLSEAVHNPELPGGLPVPGDPMEEDYQRIIEELRETLAAREAEGARHYADQMDYYTAWTHQIKTPIAAMDLLLDDPEPDRAALKNQLLRIEQYAEMALGYQRLDGGADLRIGRYGLDGIVRRAVKKYAGWFIRQGIALEYTPTEEKALTDEKWLGFVVEQILSNALKYTPQGSVAITVEPGPVLVIRDTGIGISDADLPRVFEKGYTGFNGRAEGRSTGIGLYLCRRVCGMLGHTISVESVPGEGTAVRLDLRERALRVE